MKELFEQTISLETAKLAKEKGFAIGVNHFYTEYLKTRKSDNPSFRMKKGEVELETGYFINGHELSDFSNENYINYAAPSQSLLQQWLRKNYRLYVQVTLMENETCISESFNVIVISLKEQKYVFENTQKCITNYEEGLEVGLYEALKLL